MNERIKQLDAAWDVYEEWLRSKDAFVYEYDKVRKMHFTEWLHIQYKAARKQEVNNEEH